MADLNAELRNALLRSLSGKPPKVTRKAREARQAMRMSGEVTRDVTIPDINKGAWSFIDQPTSSDFKSKQEKFYDFM